MTNIAEIIEKIKFLKKLETDKDVANYLEIAPNALNNFKRRNSLGSFLEKIVFIANNKDNSISFDTLLYSDESKIINKIKSQSNYIEKADKLEEEFVLFLDFLDWRENYHKNNKQNIMGTN